MAFKTPTLDEQHEVLIALHKAALPDVDVSETATANLELQTFAGGTTDVHAHVEAVKGDLLPQTSSGDMADRWGYLRAVERKSATPARKASSLRVVGTVATPVPGGTTWRHVSGLRFKIPDTSGEIVGPGGYVDCDLVAIDKGSATRLGASEVLTIETPIAGLEDDAELQLALDEDGTDREEDGDFVPRIVSRWRTPPLGGAQEDYVQWALEEVAIDAAYAYPLRGGYGTVHVAALHEGSGDARILDAFEVADLQAKLDKKRPVSVKRFLVLQVESEPQAIEVTILPDGEPENAFDWEDATPPTFSSWNAGTRTLTLGAARPPSMAAGHRLIFENGTTGAERVIESLGPGADQVVLEADEAGDTPVAGAVYSGGPLVEPARQAIKALIDDLGTANPDQAYGTWNGSLDPSDIEGAAKDVAGVRRATSVAPAVIVEASDPAYPDNATIGLITPGQILVRRQH